MPKPASYIPIDELSALPIRYTWNDWDPFEPLEWPDESLKQELKAISNNGITCFALGCAEWVIYRLANHFQNDLPYHYVQAFALYTAGVDEALPPETENEQWQGVILGPINLSLMTVLNTIYLAEQGPPAQNGALAAEIVRYVLTENRKFDDWKNEILERLSKHSPRTKGLPTGQPLPPEVLDPTLKYDENNRMKLIEKFVRSIDFQTNPFVKHIDKNKLQLREYFENR